MGKFRQRQGSVRRRAAALSALFALGLSATAGRGVRAEISMAEIYCLRVQSAP